MKDTPHFARHGTTTKHQRGRLKSGRSLGDYAESFFQCEAGLREGSFVEEATYQRYAVWDATWWRKLRDGAAWVGRPVGTRFGDFDKSCAHRERRMAGEIGDGQHFVAQRRNDQQIDLRKDACHFVGDFSPQPVRLHKIDG